MKTQWTKEQGSGQLPERFEKISADTYIQRRNIEEAPEKEGVTDPGVECVDDSSVLCGIIWRVTRAYSKMAPGVTLKVKFYFYISIKIICIRIFAMTILIIPLKFKGSRLSIDTLPYFV